MDLLEEVEENNLDGGLEWKILKVPLQFSPSNLPSHKTCICVTQDEKIKGQRADWGQIRSDTSGTGYIEESWLI